MIDIDASAVIQLGIVLLTFLILRGLVFEPLLESMSTRTGRTEVSRAEASALAVRAEELAKRYQNEMLSARVRAAAAKAELRSSGVRHKEQVQTEVRRDMNRKLNELRDTLGAQSDSARKEMEPQVQALSLAIAAKILGRSV